MPRDKKTKQAIDPAAAQQCGFQIVRKATQGEVLGPEECAFTTYLFPTAVPPAVSAFWGTGDTVRPTIGAQAWPFLSGIVFRNC
jgi:hypothetical protein